MNDRTLYGDGTWPFTARVDGDDIVVENVLATCFGGCFDPQDNGETASGISTKHLNTRGVALPVEAFDPPQKGSPLAFHPQIPWGTLVDVTINGMTVHDVPLIDGGPGKHASTEDEPHGIDLTTAIASLFSPGTPPGRLSVNFEKRCSYRILGAAKFAP